MEAEVRGHIRFQQQLKLHIETVESRVDQLESENIELKESNGNLLDLKRTTEQTERIESETQELQNMQAHVSDTINELSKYRQE